MSERQWERLGAAAGVAFVVAVLVSVFMVPTPPHLNDTAQQIRAYYLDHTNALLASGLVGMAAAVFFVWFIGHLRHVMNRAEAGAEAFSPVVFGSGIALATTAVV